jgi:hypothetical protein
MHTELPESMTLTDPPLSQDLSEQVNEHHREKLGSRTHPLPSLSSNMSMYWLLFGFWSKTWSCSWIKNNIFPCGLRPALPWVMVTGSVSTQNISLPKQEKGATIHPKGDAFVCKALCSVLHSLSSISPLLWQVFNQQLQVGSLLFKNAGDTSLFL